VKRHEAPDPADVSLLGAVAVVAIADPLAHGFEEVRGVRANALPAAAGAAPPSC
jgi:hypothetical protein